MRCASSEASQSTTELIASGGKKLRSGKRFISIGKSKTGSIGDEMWRWERMLAKRAWEGAVPGMLARLNSTVLSLMDHLSVRNF